MKRLLSLLAFLAGGLSAEVVHPLQCDLAPASRRVLPETERARRRKTPDLTEGGDDRGRGDSSL
ncbi:hypothetical protein [Pandoraea sputorum]|uniref:Uncharacterized protein n=1 Tax=Pandoraea sputorum TaxID=93222 RepID=A0A239SID5_9BURK|nr:hypothetical protein [Pandoraea sputorum]AJC17040.1 hypothetical protein NA29_15555 [Pandoraea sputorum]SNU85019.1 Uncharacterised protein [Pandoraea sputorum]VVD82045.1 hypothetical protein PSP20601_01156 [Pandoraea sputorum]VVE75552.1 hypothetical protein PSP31120_00514 [Pandoraea sputorum]